MGQEKQDFSSTLNEEMYEALSQESINDPTTFWAKQAERFSY